MPNNDRMKKLAIILLCLLLNTSIAGAQPWVFRFSGSVASLVDQDASNPVVNYCCESLSESQQEGEPFRFSIEVPDGNYLVTLVVGSKKRTAETSVLAESARLLLLNRSTAKGEERFDPSKPDDPMQIRLPTRFGSTYSKPDGN